MRYYTSKKHYKCFIKVAKKFAKRLGLTDWKIYFEHRLEKGNRAICEFNTQNSICTLILSTVWSSPVTFKAVKNSATHEILHLIPARLETLARHRYISPDEIHAESERIVHILHSIVVGDKAVFEVL